MQNMLEDTDLGDSDFDEMMLKLKGLSNSYHSTNSILESHFSPPLLRKILEDFDTEAHNSLTRRAER